MAKVNWVAVGTYASASASVTVASFAWVDDDLETAPCDAWASDAECGVSGVLIDAWACGNMTVLTGWTDVAFVGVMATDGGGCMSTLGSTDAYAYSPPGVSSTCDSSDLESILVKVEVAVVV